MPKAKHTSTVLVGVVVVALGVVAVVVVVIAVLPFEGSPREVFFKSFSFFRSLFLLNLHLDKHFSSCPGDAKLENVVDDATRYRGKGSSRSHPVRGERQGQVTVGSL